MQDEVKVTQWRKKPVVIAAVQINTQQDAEKCPGICTGGLSCKSKGAPDGAWPHIHTLEGDHTWTPGDWCITGVKGERYFCKPDIFEQTYEPVTDQAERETLARMEAAAVIRFDRGTPGNENEMPKVISCVWMPDGEYTFYALPLARMEPVAWMPIRTAPRNETMIVLGGEGQQTWVGFFSGWNNYWTTGEVDRSRDHVMHTPQPTHWMPLPPAPEAGQ